MKYTDIQITFSEFPDEISLCINISNCPFHCAGCHSPELWKDVGVELNKFVLKGLINANKGITLIGFMGGVPSQINELAQFVKQHSIKVGWYWGGDSIPKEINPNFFDYIKIGRYIEEKVPLNNPNTNQRMYKHTISENSYIEGLGLCWKNITNKFWK